MLDQIKTLLHHVEEYAETNIELAKLRAINSSSETLSYAISMLVIICSVMLFVFMLFIGFSILIGHALGKTEYGFFIMAGVTGICCIILYIKKETLVKNRIYDLLIKKILN
jgi:hypothetical protein